MFKNMSFIILLYAIIPIHIIYTYKFSYKYIYIYKYLYIIEIYLPDIYLGILCDNISFLRANFINGKQTLNTILSQLRKYS